MGKDAEQVTRGASGIRSQVTWQTQAVTDAADHTVNLGSWTRRNAESAGGNGVVAKRQQVIWCWLTGVDQCPDLDDDLGIAPAVLVPRSAPCTIVWGWFGVAVLRRGLWSVNRQHVTFDGELRD